MAEQGEDSQAEECESGAPAWMATFADLMSLLMCFFVLLLSFSEMDAQKYKQVAGSMKFAFGVQKKIKVKDIPKGTSIVAKEFSPGRPEPTFLKVINQMTINDALKALERGSNSNRENAGKADSNATNSSNSESNSQASSDSTNQAENQEENKDVNKDVNKDISKEVHELATMMIEALKGEIQQGSLELIIDADAVRVRIRESDSFPSGSADLQTQFYPILDKLSKILKKSKGRIIVAGHTDDIPISTRYYSSNWVLSSARAASVVHYLAEVKRLDPPRMEIRAYADTQPIVENTSSKNRAQNRRVEIIVSYKNSIIAPLDLEKFVSTEDNQPGKLSGSLKDLDNSRSKQGTK